MLVYRSFIATYKVANKAVCTPITMPASMKTLTRALIRVRRPSGSSSVLY